MKYVAYYRVSTKKQGDSGLGLEAQQDTVKGYHPILEKEFVEVKSGKNIKDRPVLQEAIRFCKETGATLVLAKIDRLSRNVDDGRWILKELPNQIEFCDIPGEVDEFLFNIFLLFAERERKNTSIRNRGAAAAKKRRGEKLGNPANFTQSGRIAGARVQAEKARISPDNERAQAHAVLLKEQGLTFSKIATELNSKGFRTSTGGQWCTSTVHRVVQRMEVGG